MDSAAFGSVAIVGIGVDILHVPRLYALIARQASRLRAGQNGCRYLAAQQFAQRIMSPEEYAHWVERAKRRGQTETDGRQEVDRDAMQKIGSTWAAKEAAFKAISGAVHPRTLTWHDASLSYIENTRRPTLRYSKPLLREWAASRIVNQAVPPRLHLSISHDGEYITAFVVAEKEGV